MCQFFFFRADPLCIATCSVLSLLISFCGSSAGTSRKSSYEIYSVHASPLRVPNHSLPLQAG